MSNDKSPSTKNIEKALGITDDLSKISGVVSDEDKKKQHEDRNEKIKLIQQELKNKRTTYDQDKDFIKDMYRELAETAMTTLRIMQDETGNTGDYKNAEAVAALATSVVNALEGFKNVEIDEEKVRIEREKLDIRRNAAAGALGGGQSILGGGSTVNNTVVHIGSTGDLIRALRQAEKDEKIADAKVVEDENKH
jgi:hypothetical protein